MNEITVQTPSDLDSRMRRSKGRLARRCGANVKLTPDELAELEGVAKREGKALGEWDREQLVAAARRPKEDVLLTELVGLRMIRGQPSKADCVERGLHRGSVSFPHGSRSQRQTKNHRRGGFAV